MQELLLSLFVFIILHLVPALGSVRKRLISAGGKFGYIVGYSLLSVALLVWVGLAYGRADTDLIWSQEPWMRWVTIILMYPACALLVGALTQANPLSVGVKAASFDPQKPAIVSVTRHPLIWALILWSVAHMVPNGDTASLVLFGLFTALGLVGPKSLDLKKRRQLGEEAWTNLAGPTSSFPFLAVLSGRTKLDWRNIVLGPGLGGLVLYALLIGGHFEAIGVSPFP